jgi:hypothetical protein
MSYNLLLGEIRKVYPTPEGVTREGTKYGGNWQVQLLCEEILRNGEGKEALITCYIDTPEAFKSWLGKRCLVPSRPYPRNGTLAYEIPPGGRPHPVPEGL